MSAGLTYETQARRPSVVLTVLAVWTGLALLWWRFDAAVWVIGLGVVCTLPALYDLVRNSRAGLRLDATGLHWFSGMRSGQALWSDIVGLRLDTRLDLSIRACIVLKGGARLRLPPDATPPADPLAAAFTERQIPVSRHHFSLLG